MASSASPVTVPTPAQKASSSPTDTLPAPARVIQSRTRLRCCRAEPGRCAPVTPRTSISTPATSRLGIATMTGSLTRPPSSCAEHLAQIDAGGQEALLVWRVVSGPQQLARYLAEQRLRLDLSTGHPRSGDHTSELQSRVELVCPLLL